jgi:hypothetical protein
LSEHKWQIGPVKLANGEDAFIDAINEGQEDWRYTGRIRNYLGFWISAAWHANGRFMFAPSDHACDLAPPPKKTVRVQTLLVVYGNGKTCNFGYSERERAVTEANNRGFALIEIDREVEEGEGL